MGFSGDGGEMRWLRLAATQGDAAAQFRLAIAYSFGRGVPEDDAEAARWYRLSAEQGYAAAQYHLGAAYAGGRGVGQDDVQAHMWFNLAAAEGSEEKAPERRNGIAEGMTPTKSRMRNAWPATGTPRTHASRKGGILHFEMPRRLQPGGQCVMSLEPRQVVSREPLPTWKLQPDQFQLNDQRRHQAGGSSADRTMER